MWMRMWQPGSLSTMLIFYWKWKVCLSLSYSIRPVFFSSNLLCMMIEESTFSLFLSIQSSNIDGSGYDIHRFLSCLTVCLSSRFGKRIFSPSSSSLKKVKGKKEKEWTRRQGLSRIEVERKKRVERSRIVFFYFLWGYLSSFLSSILSWWIILFHVCSLLSSLLFPASSLPL